MMELYKVVCIDNYLKDQLTFGKEYTCVSAFCGKLYFPDLCGGFYSSRFRELEELQETNFIELASKGETQCR
jgi:hypothetical protein